MPTFSAESTTYPYIYLQEASYFSLEKVKAEEEGSFFKLMGSMLFSAFCMEGYINFLGEKEIPRWNKIERNLGRDGRLSKLLLKIGMNPCISRRPFKTYTELFVFRDSLVHSRVTQLAITGSLRSPGQRLPKPLPEWETLINQKTAQRFIDDTTRIIKMMHKAAGYNRDPFATHRVGQWEIKP